MNEFHRFGSPELFEIAVRWTKDEEDRDTLPRPGGWSCLSTRLENLLADASR